MSVVKETLKVNDELSIDIDVIYRNGEKYAVKMNDEMLYTNDVTADLYLATIIYLNALSNHVNDEDYILIDESFDSYSLWELWNENKWRHEVIHDCHDPQYRTSSPYCIPIIRPGSNINCYFGEKDINEDVLFPFMLEGYSYQSQYFVGQLQAVSKEDINRKLASSDKKYLFIIAVGTYCDMEAYAIHFDCFIFLLYLKYPQYKNDLIRFLKYQPVCTKTSDELYLYNLKQTNKDLLKQLNEANDKVASVVKTEAKLKATEDELQSKTNELNKLMGDMVDVSIEYHDLYEMHSIAITKLKEVTDSVNAKDKEIETLKTDVEAKDKIIEQLTEVVTTVSNERDEWKSKYEKLKELLHSIE